MTTLQINDRQAFKTKTYMVVLEKTLIVRPSMCHHVRDRFEILTVQSFISKIYEPAYGTHGKLGNYVGGKLIAI